MKLSITLILIGFCLSYNTFAQSKEQYEQKIKSFEPNGTNPFGKLNPNAPPETAQFNFMIGICDCIDSIRNQDGSWITFPTIWQGKYFLNGYGIQDNYFNPQNPTSNIRLFDPTTKTWKVTYFQSARGYFSGTWEGKKIDNKIILNRESTNNQGQKTVSRLTFSNISEDGFDWVSETINPDGTTTAGWKQFCTKRK